MGLNVLLEIDAEECRICLPVGTESTDPYYCCLAHRTMLWAVDSVVPTTPTEIFHRIYPKLETSTHKALLEQMVQLMRSLATHGALLALPHRRWLRTSDGSMLLAANATREAAPVLDLKPEMLERYGGRRTVAWGRRHTFVLRRPAHPLEPLCAVIPYLLKNGLLVLA